MGMFDDIIYEMNCPKCKGTINNFQSKDGPCVLANLQFWEVNNFYDKCEKCAIWIEFTIKQRPNRKLTIKDYEMNVTKNGRKVRF